MDCFMCFGYINTLCLLPHIDQICSSYMFNPYHRLKKAPAPKKHCVVTSRYIYTIPFK